MMGATKKGAVVMPDSINSSTMAIPATIVVGGVDLVPVEVNGERVVTLAMIDEVHQRPSGTAGRNFREHRERLEEGKHFYELTADEIRRQSLSDVFPPRTAKAILINERGYLMLVKSFTDDLAWQVQDMLVESYFSKPGAAFDPSTVLESPAAMRGLLLTYTEKVLALEGEVEEMRPQVQALERIAISDGSMCITDAAKTLQVRPKTLFDFLKSHGWIYTRAGSGDYIAYQPKLQMGLLEHKTTVVTRSDGSEKTTTQVRVTPKGLARLAQEFPPIVRAA